MIKELKNFLLLMVFITTIFSCNKKLEIAPENTLVENEVFKTELGAEQAISEVYYNFLNAETNYFSYTYGDFTTPILIKSINNTSYDLGQASPVDYYVIGTWTAFFKAINSANNVIKKIPLYGNFSDVKEKQFIAEAKFVRAYSFLHLLVLYGDGAFTGKMSGLGLPLQLTPFEGYNTGEIIPRSTNGEVYAQIVKDLTESIPDLPLKQADDLKTRSRATKGGAYALLARADLYMGKFADAADAAKSVINLEPSVYTLTSNLRSLFPFNPDGTAQTLTAEYIFALPVSQLVSTSTSITNGISGAYFFKRSFWINPDFINEFDNGDLRVSQLMWKGDSIYNPDRLNDKTTFKFNNNFGRDNVPLIRYAEVLLTRAEALARTSGINQESIDLLNRIHQRSIPSAVSYTTADFGSATDLINKILLERKHELAFEGLYRYDLLRTNQPLHSPDIPDNKKVLPIPQIEIDISKGIIIQNPGYL
ncbi:MAG: RagB/SusD family nutrient uptake outer membrane protein [Ginsengibacter sp.]